MSTFTEDEKRKCIELMHWEIEDLRTQNGSVAIHGHRMYATGLLTGLSVAGVVTSEGFRELSEAIQLAGRQAANAESDQ
ncbi:hypothetical protein J3D48_006240 [Pseudomonas fluorescens]|uniref:hypothetical protein n=1 Tax=Pseudomonas fluorescens TaxID=294 RepID=UPI0020A1A412|nr:hypothetical protein [Pseudomonas fluorescens]MCP1489784.1 hypothetical protein [Pseudomonas fluorescens]MCP1489830.1 hypothetical protein [Pseudomonas fluorescens]